MSFFSCVKFDVDLNGSNSASSGQQVHIQMNNLDNNVLNAKLESLEDGEIVDSIQQSINHNISNFMI